jgi:hypothetical protein
MASPLRNKTNGAFTLLEIMVVVLIVGGTLLASLQGLMNSMAQTGHTRDVKIARELSLFKLGQLKAGLYQEDIEDHMDGDFSEQDYPDFTWEVVLGDEAFDDPEEAVEGNFNNWDTEEDREREEDEDEDEEAEKPFQEVRVKVRFPGPRESKNEITMEQWVTWSFLYGEQDDDAGGDR